MTSYLFLVAGAAAVAVWGVMHLVKTGAVVRGFEPLSDDNRHVLRMEWIVEGVALVFVAALVVATTFLVGPAAGASSVVFAMCAAFLVAMAVVSLFTGARASLLPYKLCAPIFTASAILIFVGAFVA